MFLDFFCSSYLLFSGSPCPFGQHSKSGILNESGLQRVCSLPVYTGQNISVVFGLPVHGKDILNIEMIGCF